MNQALAQLWAPRHVRVRTRESTIRAKARRALLDAGRWVSLAELSELIQVKQRSLSTTLSLEPEGGWLQRRRGWFAPAGVRGEPPAPVPLRQQMRRVLPPGLPVSKADLAAQLGTGVPQIAKAARTHPQYFHATRGVITMYADPIDQACAQEAMFTAAAAAYRKPEGPAATGHCLFCDEPLEEGRRWCDADCRNGWEKEHV